MANEMLSKKFWEASQEWVEHEKAASLLEHLRSATLSEMMVKQGDVPVSRAEMAVKASEEWKEYNKLMVASRSAANNAKVKMEYLRMRAMEQQSKEATARAEMKL